MTSPELLKVAAIKAMLEAIEEGDEEDAKQVLKMVKALLGEPKQA